MACKAGKLYVLAAPPGGGKTTLSTQIADHAAGLGIPTCYCALEMGRGQLFDYALSRRLGMNSAKVESRSFRTNDRDRAALALAAREYLETVAPFLTVIEGGWDTTAAQLAAWVAQARARYERAPGEPVLVVVDYLQLLNTGDEKLDSGPNETPKVSTVAVQLKQLARDTGAAVLALSDIIKSEQGDAIKSGKEFTLNMLRGRTGWPMRRMSCWRSTRKRRKRTAARRHSTRGKCSRQRRKGTRKRRGSERRSMTLPMPTPWADQRRRCIPGWNCSRTGAVAGAARKCCCTNVPTIGLSGCPFLVRTKPKAGAATRPLVVLGNHAPDPDAAWKAAKARGGGEPTVAPETGAIDPDWTPEWARMKNEANRLKEYRRKGKGKGDA